MPGRAILWVQVQGTPPTPIPPPSPRDIRRLTSRPTPPTPPTPPPHHWVLKVNYTFRHLATDLTERLSRYRSCLPGESWQAPASIPELVTSLTWSPESSAPMSTWSTASSWGPPSWSPAPASTPASWSLSSCPQTTLISLHYKIWCSKVIWTSVECSHRGSH